MYGVETVETVHDLFNQVLEGRSVCSVQRESRFFVSHPGLPTLTSRVCQISRHKVTDEI